MKLLIADDERLTREGLKNGIDWEALGIEEVRTAKDGKDALLQCVSFSPDILLTDVRMPHMDGIQLVAEFTKRFPEAGIIFMSGYSDREYLKAAIRYHAVSYVEKPIHLDEIRSAVSDAVAARTARHRLKEMDERETSTLPETHTEQDQISPSTHVGLIRSYVQSHYSDTGLSIKLISDHVKLSPSYICTLFKSETGETLNQYITTYRMQKAKEALSDPRNRVSDIAERVGFTDSNYFSKAFKKAFGLSPTEFRSSIK